MIQILHNVSCSKSRAAVDQISNQSSDCNIRNFIENPLSKQEIIGLLEKLNRPIIDIVRTNEALFIDKFGDQTLNDEQLIDLLVQYPALLQRPIIIKNNKAIIGRPASVIDEFLNND